jgi:hypothetical protein
MVSCLMLREDGIVDFSLRSIYFMLISQKKKRQTARNLTGYGMRSGYQEALPHLTQGNRQYCAVGTVPSPQSVLACEVLHCATRRGAPGS